MKWRIINLLSKMNNLKFDIFLSWFCHMNLIWKSNFSLPQQTLRLSLFWIIYFENWINIESATLKLSDAISLTLTSSWFFFVLALNHLLCFIPFSSSQVLNYNSVSTHIHPYTWNWLDVMALAVDWRCCAFNPVIGPQLISLFSNQFSQQELRLSSKIRSVLNILT